VPILHNQYRAEGNLPGGKVVPLPIQVGLRTQGPLVQVTVSLADSIASELVKQGKPVPAPVVGNALIDTGAVSTCIDEDAAQKLQLPVINVVNLASTSHPSTKANVYPVKFQITGLPINFNAPMSIGAPLAVQGLVALIGRDVLQHCTLIYSGGLSQISLCI
jgi:predicted aspartyl protease